MFINHIFFLAVFCIAPCVHAQDPSQQWLEPSAEQELLFTTSPIPSPYPFVSPSVTPSLQATPSSSSSAQQTPQYLVFRDTFATSGLQRGSPYNSLKFGGPCIADIDNDGTYDIILNFHNRNFSRIYFGNGDGTFTAFVNPLTKKLFRPRILDVHGISVAQLSARSRNRLVSFSIGGGRGNMPRSAEMYVITPQRMLKEVSNELGFGQLKSRPRNTIFMDMQLKKNGLRRRDYGGPDALFVNFLVPPKGLKQFAYKNIRGNYTLIENLGDFNAQNRGRVGLTDVDGDGIMEVISIQQFRFYKLISPFTFKDVTSSLVPNGIDIGFLTVTAVAELDFDNDGDFDLYVARADRKLVSSFRTLSNDDHSDILLRNDGGKYIDVTASAKIPTGMNSFGVTVGDFDNDGHVDIIVVLHEDPDMILLNRGDGTFVRVDGVIPKRPGHIGHHAVAVDYDLDGKVDAVIAHGGVKGTRLGPYMLMKNMFMGSNHYLHVTVHNDRLLASTSLHSVVTLFLPRKVKMVRRVGGRGSQDAMGSYLDTVHFGLGSYTRVNRVIVRWSSNLQQARKRVDVDQRIVFGKLVTL